MLCSTPVSWQVQASVPSAHDFPHPGRHTRRARASRLAPPPANSSAHVPERASTAAPPLDLPDVASRQSDGVTAQSQDHSQEGGGPAMSGSAEALSGPSQRVTNRTEGDCDPDPVLQAREGTPVSSNRRHYRVNIFAVQCSACSVLVVTSWRPEVKIWDANLGGEMLVSSMGKNIVADMLLAEIPLHIQLEQYTACATLMSKLSLPAAV